jgi:hypothetical protein
MADGNVTLNRPLVGVIAIVCLCAYAGLLLTGGDDSPENRNQMWAGAFGRVGLLMGALWFALPPKGKEAAWATVSPYTFLGLLLAVWGIAARPKIAIPLLLALAIAAYFVKPRNKYRPPRNDG